jgi:hypothetical protein
MNCCNKDCNQGRDCPVRVAKIGRKDHAKAPLPHSPWRAYVGHLAKWMLAFVGVAVGMSLALIYVGVAYA